MNTLQQTILFILYLLVVYIFVHTYLYLENLNKCPCFNINPKYNVDIEFMKFFQIFEILLFTMYFGLMAFLSKKTLIKKPSNNLMLKLLSSISLGLRLTIWLYVTSTALDAATDSTLVCLALLPSFFLLT